jgi:hypothetical protein
VPLAMAPFVICLLYSVPAASSADTVTVTL